MGTSYNEADEVERVILRQGGVVMSEKTAWRLRDAREDGMPRASLLGTLRKRAIEFFYLR
jgi:hypothetical protein